MRGCHDTVAREGGRGSNGRIPPLLRLPQIKEDVASLVNEVLVLGGRLLEQR